MFDSATLAQAFDARLGQRRVLIVYNPTAGGRRRARLERAVAQLKARGCAVTLRDTRRRGDAEEFARTFDDTRHDIIVAAGGDGTINEVANGLMGKSVPLGLIPLGTANVLAAELGLPETPEGQADAIAMGAVQPINVGVANGRCFLMMAGVGFDAHVVEQVDPKLKRALGKLAYVWRSLVGFVRHPFKTYRLMIDGKPHEAASAIIANGHYYGGKFVCAREASLQDPAFHVCLFKSEGPFSAMRYAAWLVLGRLHKLPDFEVVRAKSVVIEGYEAEPVQGDGDVLARLPLTAISRGEPLNLLVPA